MRKLPIVLAALAAAASASAVLNLELVNNSSTFTLAPGGSVTMMGDIIGVENDVTSYTFVPGVGFTFTPDPAFLNYISLVTSTSYGSSASPLPIGTITAGPTPGLFLNVLSVFDPGATGGPQSDGENIKAQVTPEPASFAALGLGVTGLLYRRRRNYAVYRCG